MNLRKKVFILIAIPIVGQFAFLGFIFLMQRDLEEQSWKEMHFRTQTQELTSLSILMYKSIGVLSVYGMSNQPNSLKAFDEVYQQLQRKVELVSLLDRDRSSEISKRAKVNFTRMMSDLYSARQMIGVKGQMTKGASLVLVVNDLRREIQDSLTAIEQTIAERVKESQSDVQHLEQQRTRFQVGVCTFFTIDTLICSIVFIIFARGLARRFDLIVDNTHRISQGQALNDPVKGNDELTELDDNLREMDIALREAQARKEQLMNMVSHDLRGPLTTVMITFEMLLNKGIYDLSDKATKKISDTDKLVKRLSRMVNDVLDFDKLKVGKLDLVLDMVPLPSMLDECIGELQPLLDKEQISVRVETEDINVIADRERVPQIIINLLANAIKFSPEGSEILISTCRVKGSTDSPENEFAKVSIKDKGPGVPELYRETIFLPFEQVPDDKRPKKGSSGLGLPICKMLVNLHGGQIGVDVPENDGSIFWFTLPIAESDEL